MSAIFCRWPSRTGSAERSSRRATPRSVLLIDDSPFFRNMLTPVLQAAGYQVTAVGARPKRLPCSRTGHVFDVAVTDIEMPDMDGFQFAEAVRANRGDRRSAGDRAFLGRFRPTP